jgi:hypothetical protein
VHCGYQVKPIITTLYHLGRQDAIVRGVRWHNFNFGRKNEDYVYVIRKMENLPLCCARP